MPRSALAALALALLVPASALADKPSPGSDPGGCEALRTVNATTNKIWVTVYDAGHLRHLDYGWVDPCSIRVWRAGSYACGSFYHVRAEVKAYDVSKPNVYDTQVQFNPQGNDYGTFALTLRRGKDNYYWEHGNTAGCTPTGMTACCKAGEEPPQGAPAYQKPVTAPARADFTFDNASPAWAKVHVYHPYEPKIHDDCVPPKTKATWNVSGQMEYRVRVEAHLKGCDDGKALATHVGKAELKDGKAAATFEYSAETRRYGFSR